MRSSLSPEVMLALQKNQARSKPNQHHQQAGKNVETMFVNYLVKLLMSSVERDDFAEKMMTPLLAEKIAEKMTERGMGVGTIVAADLARASIPLVTPDTWVNMPGNEGEQ